MYVLSIISKSYLIIKLNKTLQIIYASSLLRCNCSSEFGGYLSHLCFCKCTTEGASGTESAWQVQAMQEILVWSLCPEHPLEKEMATPLIFLTGKSHGQKSLVGYSPWGRNGQTSLKQSGTQASLIRMEE